ncbi:MAG TPA: GlsB/YeaQ/YmgE family stress response membrane protein [Bacteroidales bacterium]|nr:GlsB/YeaQ/YmgE family stress response membrane protein [Lentimicrobiaceae bacterium]MDD5695933.1 GlsB/YeaQ/YmgE family stress response membrane protein [Bacteroidales bacterium]HNS17651.1 GlsB/YeaQ/YmgE family stress response membrane protein [Bacteroidales bacterium]HNS45900.1 GlsB/YeaQ/YmgE family stress response membrane protein [Bacteroidales bacterium]
MGILSWIVIGLIAGVIAKFIMPGKDPGGLIITILIGIAGGLIGGYIGTLLGLGSVKGFDWKSILLAVAGSILLLLILRLFRKKA